LRRLYHYRHARPGEDLAKIEKDIDEELARFLAKGPTQKELGARESRQDFRLRARYRADWRVRWQIGHLAMNQTFVGDPQYYKMILKYEREATARDILEASRKMALEMTFIFSSASHPEYETTSAGTDRSKLPTPGSPPEVKFPALQRAS